MLFQLGIKRMIRYKILELTPGLVLAPNPCITSQKLSDYYILVNRISYHKKNLFHFKASTECTATAQANSISQRVLVFLWAYYKSHNYYLTVKTFYFFHNPLVFWGLTSAAAEHSIAQHKRNTAEVVYLIDSKSEKSLK